MLTICDECERLANMVRAMSAGKVPEISREPVDTPSGSKRDRKEYMREFMRKKRSKKK